MITAPDSLEELFELAGRRMADYVELLPVHPYYRLIWSDGDRFDYHRARQGLKLVKDTGDTKLLKNKEGYACPACGNPFEQLYVSEKQHNTFDPSGATPFCIRRESDRILMFRH